MSYLIQSDAFRGAKQFFFSLPANKPPIDMSDDFFKQIDTQANNEEYYFLLTNQQLIETEFNNLYATLDRQNPEDKKQFWLWCYYCASLLEIFYSKDAYDHSRNKEQYSQYKKKIKNKLNNVVMQAETEQSFLESMWDSFKTSFSNILDAPYHLSKMREYVSIANLYRIYWAFSRMTMTQGLIYAKSIELLDKVDWLLGTVTDINKIIAGFQIPTVLLNYCSVLFFAACFVFNSLLLLRHTLFPSKREENAAELDRFKYEIYKRHFGFANDLVWAVVNLVTNFNHLFLISGPVATYIIAGFLVFDVSMAFYKHYWAYQEYSIKKAQYEEDKDFYFKNLELTEDEQLAHTNMLNQQLADLEKNWNVKQSTFYFQVAAATLLMAGFTAALFLTCPGLLVCAYFVCAIAVSMYISTGAFIKYQEKAHYLEEFQTDIALKEYEMARTDFIITLSRNIIPMLLIITFAICWPAALVLTAVYLGAEAGYAYKQHVDTNAAKQLPLDGPIARM